MRVGIVSCHDFIEGYGSNAKIKAYAKGLMLHGVNVELLFLVASTHNQVNKLTEGKWEGIPFQYLNKKSYRPISLSGKIADTIRSAWFSSFHFLGKGKKYDLLFLYSPSIVFFWPLFLSAKLYKIPIVAEWTELHSLTPNPKSYKYRLAKSLNRFDEINAHRFVDHLLVISRKLYSHYSHFFSSDQISLMPVIVDIKRFSLPAFEKKFTIGYLGSFGGKDGVDGILEAFSNVVKKNPGLKLVLMGPMYHRAKKSADELQLSEGAKFTGHVSFDEIPQLLNQCDLLLMNRTNDPFSHYGFPAKLAEYLATGRPTIVTRVGDVEEYLQHGVDTYMIEPENDEQLTEAILLRYKEYERFNEIGRRGRETAQKYFSHEQHVDKLLEIFHKVIEEKKDRKKRP